MKNKKKDWFVLGLVVVGLFFLFMISPLFLGSTFLKCNNYEPRNFQEYVRSLENMGGRVISTDAFSIQIGSSLEKYNTYYSSSVMGELFVIPMEGGLKCDAFLERVNTYPFYQGNTLLSRQSVVCETGYAVFNNICLYNSCWSAAENLTIYNTLKSCNEAVGNTTSFFSVKERRQVLETSAGYMFCNYENNMALIATTPNALSNYVNQYVVCMDGPSGPPAEDEPRQEDSVVTVYVNVEKEVESVAPVKFLVKEFFEKALILLLVILAGFLTYRKFGRRRRK